MSDRDWTPVTPTGGDAVPPTAPPASAPPASAPPQPPYGAPPSYPPPAYPPPAYPPPAGAPTYGAPQYGAPQYGAPQYGAPGGAGWTPPPKPGLIPLRPIGFGTLLGAPFQTLRRNPAATFGSALLVQLVVLVVSLAVTVPMGIWTVTRIENAAPADVDAVASGSVGVFLVSLLVPIAVGIVGTAFLQGVIVNEVASGTLGEKLRFGEIWRRTARRVWPLAGWSAIVTVLVLLLVAAAVAVVVLGALTSPVALAIAIVVILFGGLGLAVLFSWLGVKLSIVPSVIVIEGAGIRAAMGRSWRLTNGAFWRTFGVLLLVQAIVYMASQIVSFPLAFGGSMATTLIDPTGTGSGTWIYLGVNVLIIVVSIVLGAVTAVVQSALLGLIYLDRRMRTEGLDLELRRHVERRAAGEAVDEDPYAVPEGVRAS